MVDWGQSRTPSFEEWDEFYKTEDSRTVIIKVKTANKKVEVDRGAVPEIGIPGRWTCPQLVLTKAKVTEIFFVHDEFEYSIKSGDTIWLASEYIVLDQYKLILLPGSPIGNAPLSTLYLPNTEYLLYATLETVNQEHKYKNRLLFSCSSPRQVIALDYSSSWSEYTNIMYNNGFPNYIKFSDTWDAAIEKYIK